MFIGTSVVTIRDFDTSSNYSFYLGYGSFCIICSIRDSKGSISQTIISIEGVIADVLVESANPAINITYFTDSFLESNYFQNTTNFDDISAPAFAGVSMFSYIGDYLIDSDSSNNNSSFLINSLKTRRRSMMNHLAQRRNVINYLIQNELASTNISDDIRTEWLSSLQTQSQLINVVAANSQQIDTITGKSAAVMFGDILENVNGVEKIHQFDTLLNDATADALTAGFINVGTAFALDYDDNERRRLTSTSTTTAASIDVEDAIAVTQIGLALIMIAKLDGNLPGESGYYYKMTDGSIVDAMRQAVDNLENNSSNTNDICGSEYIEYNQIGNVLGNKGINQFNCLFSIQPSEVYSNVPGEESISNILSLEFTTVPNSFYYSVEEIITDLLSNSSSSLRAVENVINESGL